MAGENSFRLFPTKRQWQKWSLPARLTAIGAYAGILGIILSTVFFLSSTRNPDPQPPTISDDNKRLFTFGFVVGSHGAKILHRRMDVNENIAMPGQLEDMLPSLLVDIGYSPAEANESVSRWTVILGKASADASPENTREQFAAFTELQRSFSEFIESRYGKVGVSSFSLGSSIAFIRRIALFFDDIEALQNLPPDSIPEKYRDFDFGVARDTMLKFSEPHIEAIKFMAIQDLFPDSVKKSMNIVATEDISKRTGRDKIVEELTNIGFEFGLLISKQPKIIKE